MRLRQICNKVENGYKTLENPTGGNRCYFYCAFKSRHFAILQRLFDNLSLVTKVCDEECLSIKTFDGNNIYYFHLIPFSGFRGTASQVDFPL